MANASRNDPQSRDALPSMELATLRATDSIVPAVRLKCWMRLQRPPASLADFRLKQTRTRSLPTSRVRSVLRSHDVKITTSVPG